MSADPVTLTAETFAQLAGTECPDTKLFRVSDAFLEFAGDNEWHGPVRWRFVRQEGHIVELEMQNTGNDYEALLADALTLMDHHASDELKDEARHRIIDRDLERQERENG